MTTQFLAILASAGLVTAGVAASAETRSASAIPAASMVGVAKSAKAASRIPTARQGNAPDCTLPSNASLPACSNPGVGPVGNGGGVSGAVLGAIAAGLGVAGIVVAAKNDSNG